MCRYSPVWRGARARALVAACIACLAIAPSALAGINPLKKVKAAVTKETEKKAEPQTKNNEPVVFDEYVLDLTDARIQSVLAACKKASAAVASRQVVVDKLNKTSDERNRLGEKEGEAVRELQRKRSDVEVCYHDAYQANVDKRREEYASKATTDPAILRDFTRIAQEQAMAQAQNDTLAFQKATAAMMKWVSPTREDTLAVKKKCGSIPAHSAAEDRLAAYDTQIASLNDQIRQADEQAVKEQAQASGMNPQQWAMARERIVMFLGKYNAKGPDPLGFSDTELDTMEKYLNQLRDAQKGGCL